MNLLPLAALFAALSPAAAPNLVVIDVCSLRADRVGAYGYTRDTTPSIDRLAAQGVLFENAMAQGSWCLPNYATLFTGRPPEAHGLYTNEPRPLPPDTPTLAETLKKSGYETAAFSGGVYLLPEWGLTRGFDHYASAFSTAGVGRAQAPVADYLDEVQDWLKTRASRAKTAKPGAKPFFLYLAVDDLHAPLQLKGPERYDPGYEGVALDTRTMGVPFARAYSGEKEGWPAELEPLVREFKSDPRHMRHLSARYDSAVREMDAGIGRLLDELKSRGLGEDTVVLLTADHGESLGEHGLLGHTQGLYEPTLRVPLIVLKPGRPDLAGRRVKALVERGDLMPTLLDWAGAPAPPLPGRSIEPLLADPAAPWRDYAFASSRRNLAGNDGRDLRVDERVARDGRWKLLWTFDKGGYELYDLVEDPGETRDLAAERPEIVARLAFELARWVEEHRPHRPGPPERREPSVRLETTPAR
ncbi:MAG: sulfatase [Elusimicrobiota bacterium]|nr:sulfatase [Elusimicrobiota bacterium]